MKVSWRSQSVYSEARGGMLELCTEADIRMISASESYDQQIFCRFTQPHPSWAESNQRCALRWLDSAQLAPPLNCVNDM